MEFEFKLRNQRWSMKEMRYLDEIPQDEDTPGAPNQRRPQPTLLDGQLTLGFD